MKSTKRQRLAALRRILQEQKRLRRPRLRSYAKRPRRRSTRKKKKNKEEEEKHHQQKHGFDSNQHDHGHGIVPNYTKAASATAATRVATNTAQCREVVWWQMKKWCLN